MSGSGESGKSKDKGKSSGSRRKLITDDDQALWRFVAKSIGPARGKSRVRDVEPTYARELSGDFEAELEAKLAARLRDGTPSHKQPSKVKNTPLAPVSSPSPARPARSPVPAPQHVTLDRRKARRIARGADEIDARLDLHGMTQADAHWALIGFVRRCHAGGLRTLLVITGKGNPARGDGDDVVPRPRGVLRQNVPRWLAGPEIGALVVSYTTAHIRHGGEGALYVHLRA